MSGQSALKYLITYGWAILAIVIVVAILWHFHIFNPSYWVKSKQCGGWMSFECVTYDYNGSTLKVMLVSLGNSTISSPYCAPAFSCPNTNIMCFFEVGNHSVDEQVSLPVVFSVDGENFKTENGFARIV